MTENISILVVDDDRLIRAGMVKQLRAHGYRAEAVDGAKQALLRLESGGWDLVLSDLRMPGMDGIEFLKEVRQRFPDLEVIMMTAYGTVETAVEAMRLGAADFLTKPFHLDELEVRVHRIAHHAVCRRQLDDLRGILDDDPNGLFGRSEGIHRVRERIRSFANGSAPVLITGETGTGKEVVARAIHRSGSRAKGPFVAVGCGTIPRELAESELFGHEKGAFTGATSRRKGTFERADGGILLLDDVDDLPADVQVKLLRVLQEGTLSRVGSEGEIHVDVRIVATTKVKLADQVEAGTFRPDLFYRLRGLEIHLPPLRERGEDVAILADRFLRLLAAEAGAPPKSLSTDALDILRAYRWPGNVRELRRAMEAADTIATGEEIQPSDLPSFLLEERANGNPFTIHYDQLAGESLSELVHRFEVEIVEWALRESGGNQSSAARLLGVPRTTLQSKLSAE